MDSQNEDNNKKGDLPVPEVSIESAAAQEAVLDPSEVEESIVVEDVDAFLPDDILADDSIPGVLTLYDKKYAVGLTWLTAQDDISGDLVKNRAKTMNADFYCVRPTIVVQHGFGALSKGHRRNMPAAAALAADTLIGEWHGAFETENGWWYVAVHADAVAPDGDILFDSEEDAYNHFLAQNEMKQWPRSYAPGSWNLSDVSAEISVERLLSDDPTAILKPASPDAFFGGRRNKTVAMIAFLAFLCFLLFALVLRQILPSIMPEIAQDPVAVIDASGELAAPPPEPILIENNIWDLSFRNIRLPEPGKVLDLCIGGFSDLAHSFPGWQLSIMRCRGTRVEASWLRTTGSLDGLRAHLDQFPVGVRRSFSGSSAFTANRNLGNLRDIEESIVFMSRAQAIVALNERLGKLGRMVVNEQVPNPLQEEIDARTNNFEAPQLTLQDLPVLKINLQTRSAPNMMRNYFDLDGLALHMVEWNVTTGLWSYEASLFLELTNSLKAAWGIDQ